MEDIIFRTEERDNYLDLSNRTIELSEIDRVSNDLISTNISPKLLHLIPLDHRFALVTCFFNRK
jgi:hypothetical protein